MFDIKKRMKQYLACKNWMSFDIETAPEFDPKIGAFFPYHGDRIFSYCYGTKDSCWVNRLDNGERFSIDTNDLIKCINNKVDIRSYLIHHEIHSESKKDAYYYLRNDTINDISNNTALIIHNCKFEAGFLSVMGIKIPDDIIIHDTMLMSRELDNQSPSHELLPIVRRLGGDPLEKITKCDKLVKNEAKKLGSFEKVNIELMTEYQLYDAIMPLLLQDIFWPEILKNEKLTEDYIWEVQTALDTQKIEEEGISLHKKNCNELIKWLDSEIEKMQHESFEILGEYINMSSDSQIARILFDVLGFEIVSFTNTGIPKTDKDVIFKLQENSDHPFLDLLLKWRSYIDGRSIIKSYDKFTDGNGKIHTTLNTMQARTHRQSSSKPNLQNVAKESVLRNKYPIPARKCFKCHE